ncbi:hypothetical protein J437_LFUL018011 [Ladona fulva]|uniref:Uncharacterized protein n=1 Tax=Ladona fulva TaxID=123851 RepID=A0A8K0KQF5_LADFU|nr:hypothetical protein J437_LFUL018011 [Ladona fulva]
MGGVDVGDQLLSKFHCKCRLTGRHFPEKVAQSEAKGKRTAKHCVVRLEKKIQKEPTWQCDGKTSTYNLEGIYPNPRAHFSYTSKRKLPFSTLFGGFRPDCLAFAASFFFWSRFFLASDGIFKYI